MMIIGSVIIIVCLLAIIYATMCAETHRIKFRDLE